MKRTLLEAYRRLYERFGPQGWWPADGAFEVMVGAVLTQNTNWANVEKAIANLKRARALSSPLRIKNTPIRKLAALIRSAGYYNIKAKRLKSLVGYLASNYGGSLKRASRRGTEALRRELLEVYGIGPETADSILLYAFNRPVFVVDAYTVRVLSRHGFIRADAVYDEVRKVFMDNLPADPRLFNEYHALLVRLGKEHCRTIPRCAGCPMQGYKIPCK